MISTEEDVVLRQAVDVFGKEAQLLMLLEKMTELQKEILKHINRRRDNLDTIMEETADVEIVLHQLKYIFGIQPEKLREVRSAKIQKLKKLLEDRK